jgi:hypothetical protein
MDAAFTLQPLDGGRNKSVRSARPFAMIEPHVRAWLAGPDSRERR